MSTDVPVGRRPRRPVLRFAFTEKLVAALERPTEGSRYVYDTVEAGLCIRLTPGVSRYVFYCWHHGKPERLTLDKVGSVQLREMRRIVTGLRGDLARGADVFAGARLAKKPAKPLTLNYAFEAHIARPDLRPGTKRDYESAWQRVPPRLKSKPIADINNDDLKRLHNEIGAEHPRLANKLTGLISCLLHNNGRQGDNPATGVRRFRESPRERVLTLAELRRLRDAVEDEHEPWRSYFALAILTGSRRGSLARMRWVDIDLDEAVWRLPAEWSKNRKVLTAALPSEAVAILRARHEHECRGADAPAAQWVFPARSQAGHLTGPKRAWKRVCERARIHGARIHDLRRTLATALAADGANPALIATALGHVSQASARHYVHLSAEMARSAVEKAARRISRAA
jgi:integrase